MHIDLSICSNVLVYIEQRSYPPIIGLVPKAFARRYKPSCNKSISCIQTRSCMLTSLLDVNKVMNRFMCGQQHDLLEAQT